MSFTAVNTSRTTHLTCENNTILAECIVFQYSHLPLTISSGETYRTLKCLMTDIISIMQTRKLYLMQSPQSNGPCCNHILTLD